jgi:hypothetical protein
MSKKRLGLRRTVGLATFVAAVAAALFIVPSAFAAGNAAYTTFDSTVGGCLNGSPNGINCNIYDSKDSVYMNGGPTGGNGLDDGSYYFAVLTPGSQNGGFVDGATGNLSDTTAGGTTGDAGSGDDVSNRTFTVTDGLISAYGGTHANGTDPQGNPIIGLAPFDDTNNPGGVYILAICKSGSTSPSDCKYDAFKVKGTECVGDCGGGGTADDLAISKDAAGAYTTTWTWGIAKAVDQTLVKKVGGTVTFNYTVTVTHDSGANSGITVSGKITVTNPNSDPVSIDSVTDQLSDGTVCSVTGGGAQTLTGGGASKDFPYTCSPSAVSDTLNNTATVTWPTQFLSPSGDALVGSNAPTTVPVGAFSQTKVDDCATITDPLYSGGTPAGTLGTVCSTDTSPTTFKYSNTVNVPASGCVTVNNTATFTTNTTGTTGSAGQSVQVCGPTPTGALTIGFWKNSNGNSLIQNYCAPANKTSLATYLSGLGTGSGPFSDAAGKTCSQLVTYVNNIIKGATATNMNVMLKAQMLATALDVYFSSYGYTATSVSKTKPPSNFLPNGGIGTFNMDMTAICPMVDNTTTGTATCKNNTPSTNASGSGAVPNAAMTVNAILTFAATVGSSPWATGAYHAGDIWYYISATSANRTFEEVLKNIFDQINNNDAFAAV